MSEVPSTGKLAALRGAARRDGFRYPEGRKFQVVPRVMRCHGRPEAVVLFHGADSPFGNPRAIWDRYGTAPEAQRKIRLYGFAERGAGARFSSFERKVHVVDDAEIPAVGTDYLMVDPHSARNFAMMWVRCVKDRHYVRREWPGSYEIPGHGTPGPWAEPDAKRPDGRPGSGQRSFGMGFLGYKQEIARLEKWKDWKDAAAVGMDRSKCKPVSEWSEANGAEEPVYERIMDSRALTSPKLENERVTSLQMSFADIGLWFQQAKGDDLTAGDELIQTALHFDREQWEKTGALDYFSAPKLYVAKSCMNTRFMFENFTGLKENGTTDFSSACKEWADLLRYYFLAMPVHVEGKQKNRRGGVYF